MSDFIFRAATASDLIFIIKLLIEDELGKDREEYEKTLNPAYIKAFEKISNDSNQFLMVVELMGEIIGTCHLTIMPSLTMVGTTRMNIEAVRISEKHRGKKIGEWMIKQSIEFAKSREIGIIQLTTNTKRPKAKIFYERLGFVASHIGMKLKI